MQSRKNKAILQMVICSVLWSIAGIFIKLINCNAVVIAGLRGLIAAAVIFVFMHISKEKFVFTKKTALGALMGGISFLCFVAANKLTTAANAIVLQFTLPVFILVFSALFFRKKIRRADIVVVALTFLGIALFFFDSIGGGKTLGNILAVIAGAGLALMFIITGEQTESERMSCLACAHLMTAAVSIPFLFFTQNTFDAKSIICILILGIFQLGIPYILFGLAVGACPPLACSLISALEPLLNPVWVLIFDGEKPGIFALIGGIIVITSVTAWCIYNNQKETEKLTS